ncbi:MAG: xanthine dehydrogenase accessory protein XdhC, partial [Candidatus Saccharibacteria bacterium]|nr:xanthine dehydrogenase accessory protein XdhC [Rhodoferax sp.]
MQWLEVLRHQLLTGPAVLVSVVATRGSVPRDAGTWMAVFASELAGTVGGGRLEQDAIDQARVMLRQEPGAPEQHSYSLGPSLGQCCGGEVRLQFEWVSAQDTAALTQRLTPVHTP